ncbi:MAG: diguanylate cyclase, partial [Alkalispirochaeta sp.]
LIISSCMASTERVSVTAGTGTIPPESKTEISVLTGSWEVYVGQAYPPDRTPESTPDRTPDRAPDRGGPPSAPQYRSIPPVRGRYYTDGGARFVTGPITYRLSLNSVPQTPLMGIHIPPSSGETIAWVNGERIGLRETHSVIPVVPDGEGGADVTILIDGHHYPREGLTLSPARIGPLSELLRETGRRVFWDGLLVGMLVVLAAYHLLLRLGQSPGFARNVPTVTLSVFLGILALRILLIEGSMILSSVPWLGPAVYLRLRGIVVYPLVALYLRYLNHMFPGDSQRTALRVLESASWVWMVLSVGIPARWWMDLLFTWLPLLVAALGTSVVTLLRACRAGRNSAHLLVVAVILLVVGSGIEIARCMGWIATSLTAIPLTLAVFGGMNSLALSRRIFDARISLANLREQAQHDGLTGLDNRRTLDAKLDEEWGRHMRSGNSLAAIMVDIDHFKQYNDTLGHQAGDIVIQEVARTLTEHAQRTTDVAARYGGEEFFLLLPNTTAADAYLLAERIRSAMHTRAIPHPTTDIGIVTLSIGVTAVVPEHQEHGPRGARSLVEAADRALYDAKRGGRDAVRTANADANADR